MSEIQVNNNSWHTKLYKFWYKQKYGREHVGSYSNLCPYMRAVLFWSWMRPLFLTKWFSVIPWALLAIEIPRWAGMFSHSLKFVIWVLYGATAVAGTLLGLAAVICWLWDKHEVTNKLDPMIDKGVSFCKLVVAYSRSAHDRICPEIIFQ